MAKITWVTPAGDLGTYPENVEFSFQLEADDPLAPNSDLGFDPRNSLTGNGIPNQVTVKMDPDKTRWQIQSLNLPGFASAGAFPNDQNPNRITAQPIDAQYPYRGGRNKVAETFAPLPMGPIGISAVGVVLFGPAADMRILGLSGTIWNVNANTADVFGEDQYGGHPQQNGMYHYHDTKFINNNAWGNIDQWKNGYRHADGHSKIIGWAADGYPIYGPYGYINPMSASAIVRMQSGYTTVPSDYRPRPVAVKIPPGRYEFAKVPVVETTGLFPGQRIRGPWPEGKIRIIAVFDKEILLNQVLPTEIRPGVRLSAYWPVGVFVEDYRYTSPQGTSLDTSNGRYCVTPDFPSGTYAYFSTEDINGEPVYPYMVGPNYYGDITPDDVPGTANIEPAPSLMVYSLLSGSLPAGIQLRRDGLVYGFPAITTVGTNDIREYSFTVRVTNTIGQIADRTFVISVNNIIPPQILTTGIRGEGVGQTIGNIDLAFTNIGSGYFSNNVSIAIGDPDTTGGESAIAGKVYLHANGAIKAVGLVSPGTGYTSLPAITFTGGNTVSASCTITSLTNSGRENLGYYFDGDYVDIKINALEVSATGTLQWQVSQGSLPPGLTIDQTGRITGFAQAPARPGSAGTAAYDVGRYDQFVYDFEGAADSRVYLFNLRIFDGINYVDQRYRLGIYDKTYFLVDNELITADSTRYTADRDGYQYPSIITASTTLPPVRQGQQYAYQFQAYISNPNLEVKWSVNSGGPARFDQGASPNPDDNNQYFTVVPYDDRSFDQTDLSLPGGIFLDGNTGWLLGRIGTVTQAESTYEFTVTAYVEVPISQTTTSIRSSQPVKFSITVLSDIEETITWLSTSDLGTIDNGQISSIAIEASTNKNSTLTYKVKSGQYLRVPQGLSLQTNGLLSGRTAFDYFSMDRKNSEITFDRAANTYDSKYVFTVIAQDATGLVYNEKEFTITVTNVNTKPYENLYLKALLPATLRQVFRSIVTDERLSSDAIIYRLGDPYYGIHLDLTMLVQAGVRAETASAFVDAMANYHYDKKINFGTIKKAVARYNNGDVKYEVLYVEVFDYNNKNLPGTTVALPSGQPRVFGSVDDPILTSDDLRYVADKVTRSEDFGSITDPQIIGDTEIYSNSFANMQNEIEQGIGYEFQGALPEWMQSIQPDTGVPLGFVRGLVLAYAKPGQGDKLLYRYKAALTQSGYGVVDIMNTFKFVADRYQWDRTLSVNYDPDSGSFVPSQTTTFDRIPSAGIVEKGAWINRDSGIGTDLQSIVYGSGSYVAVGKNSRVLVSTSGTKWNIESQRINLDYSSALISNLAVGGTTIVLPYTSKISVDDEVLQSSVFDTNTRCYINSINNAVRLSANLANALPSGTGLEFIDYRNGGRYYATTSNSTSAGTSILFVNTVIDLSAGYGVIVRGIDIANATVVTANVGSTLTLGNVTTHQIPSGTKITFDNLQGQVEILTTSGTTPAGNSLITFTSLGNVTAGFYPRLTAIPVSTTTQSLFTYAGLSQASNNLVLYNTELEFTHRLTAAASIGATTLYFSNTDQLSLGTEIFAVSTESNTTNNAHWAALNTPGIILYITVPYSAINGDILRGMRVVGPGLPASAVLSEIAGNATVANLTLSFASSTVTAQTNVAISFLTPTVVSPGTTIIGKNSTSISLSSPITANLGIGADATIGFGLTGVELTNVIFDGLRFVAVGDRGLIIDREIGTSTWNQRFGLVYGDLKAIGARSYYTANNLQYTYVAVGNEGVVIRSIDLDSWSLPIATLANRTLNSISHNNGQWVAVGEGGQIITSTDDGLSWTLDNTTTELNLYDVAYFGQWIAVGDKGYVYLRSQNSVTWNRYNVGISDSLRSIAFINNVIYVVGARGTVVTSLEGTKWTVADRFTTNRLNGISRGANTPVAVGASGVILSESPSFTVTWAVRNIAFDKFNFVTVRNLEKQGYRVQDGDTLIFAQQEGFGGLNDGWNQYSEIFGAETDSGLGFDTSNFDQYTVIPGYIESIGNSSLSNQRAGIWKVIIDANNIVTLEFQRQILPGQVVNVVSETTKLFYDPQVKAGKTIPEYSLISSLLPDSTQNTSFDTEGTRFSSNRDNFTEPGTLDKYLKFPKTGVFR
jgi:photosystem II stability/assembly factor-like uncharacterized protein